MTKERLTQERLKELLHYDHETGIFTWVASNRAGWKGKQAGYLRKDGYIGIMIDGTECLAHRAAFLYVAGELPNADTDHINHKRNDNRFSNLRMLDRANNAKNAVKSSANTSGITGVYWHKTAKKWQSSLTFEGEQKHLYCGGDFFEAVCARKSAEIRYGFHENHGRAL
jgi:hypothetical protein